ncbi:MAG: HEAT repeat domain-containing protein [Desulfobacteraceae bacterium]|nr:HEAT repeat domain-containing protein [Desulfobacteraceae bacterium]
MTTKTVAPRVLKRKVFELLKSNDFVVALEEFCRHPPRKVINSLFSFLYNIDPEIKWNAVTAMGAVVEKLAHEDTESARVIIRRLMWNLNDESGGIGWGSPEALGEILARSKILANEYSKMLISYAREDGNFQEQELMQRGVLWGVGRLSQVRPNLIRDAAPYLIPYLQSSDAGVRGHAAWVMGLLGVEEARSNLERLIKDTAELQIYRDCKLIKVQVKELAEEVLKSLSLEKRRF